MIRFFIISAALSFSTVSLAEPNDMRISETRWDLKQNTQPTKIKKKKEDKKKTKERKKTFVLRSADRTP